MLNKKVEIDRIEILSGSQVQIREKTSFLEDGVEVSYSFSRRVVNLGDDCSKECDLVREVCNVVRSFNKGVV